MAERRRVRSADQPSSTVPLSKVPPSPVGSHVRVPKTAELVAAQLRRRIIKGELAEGEALAPEATLMEQFGVSRPTLREAFRVLEAEALIIVRRGARGGARVHAPDGNVAARYAGLILEHRGTTVADVHQASAVLEPACVSLLTRSRTAADVARLREVLAMAEAPGLAPLEVLKAQQHFHHVLVELTGNETLLVLVGMLRHIMELADESYVASESAAPAARRAAAKGQRAHVQLVDLIEAADAEGAADLWSRHLVARGDQVRSGAAGAASGTVLDLLG